MLWYEDEWKADSWKANKITKNAYSHLIRLPSSWSMGFFKYFIRVSRKRRFQIFEPIISEPLRLFFWALLCHNFNHRVITGPPPYTPQDARERPGARAHPGQALFRTNAFHWTSPYPTSTRMGIRALPRKALSVTLWTRDFNPFEDGRKKNIETAYWDCEWSKATRDLLAIRDQAPYPINEVLLQRLQDLCTRSPD